MIKISHPSNDTKFAIVSGIIDANSRDVILRLAESEQICPTCSGTNYFCSQCNGTGKAKVTVDVKYKAAIRWNSEGRRIFRSEGQLLDGNCEVILLLTSGLLDHVYQTTRVIADQKVCTVKQYFTAGNPINRVHFVLKEEEDLRGMRAI